MTIKEVEERTGLARSNIRFYEKERLIEPSRNKNGYRDYSERDVEIIKKIAFLRTLEISVEDIRGIISDKLSLSEIIEKQAAAIQEQIEGLNKAKIMCERMIKAGNVSFEELQIEKFTEDPKACWNDNKPVFQLDSVSFLYIWGSLITWIVITVLCVMAGTLSYTNLPPEMPVQWSGGTAVSFMDKKVIFIYPLACMIIRLWLRPVLYGRLSAYRPYGELITEYLSNFLCFIVLSAEVFSILFVCGLAKNIVMLLLADTFVFAGMLIAGGIKMGVLRNPAAKG